MYPGTWKSTKIIPFNFLENWIKSKLLIFWGFSCPRGHENWRKLNRLIFEDFYGSWKLKKIKLSHFCEISCSLGFVCWSVCFFLDFHVPGVPSFYLITQKSWLKTSKRKYKHFKCQNPIPWCPKTEPIKNLSPPVVVSGIRNLVLRVSLQSDRR